ncbi:hypothetical protein [Micrococcus luteus]|uniref:hypothetical protein n=1 Tax=Micrococcus luteus TaxID=1270 RepID=UPI00100951EF|nr:hypothetical protein [Micrococcus luteus]QAV29298.1 hypothetical protein MT1254_08240 [Micrococcus luteus]
MPAPIAPADVLDYGHHDLLFADFVLTGRVTYDRRRQLLELHGPDGNSEVLNTDLRTEGYLSFPGEVILKDWSEHSGLCQALVDAGVVMRTASLRVGPFDSRAYRCLLLDPEVAR